MVRVLGIEGHLPNAEVLHHITLTRARHVREDAASTTDRPRPSNHVSSLEKHSRHLSSAHYPYTANPSSYATPAVQNTSFKRFAELHMQRIQLPLCEKYVGMVERREMEAKKAKRELEREQSKKELSEPEWLMLVNHAPKMLELMQPMIEEVEERFTDEEQAVLVQCIREALRADETGAVGNGPDQEDEEDVAMDVDGRAEVAKVEV